MPQTHLPFFPEDTHLINSAIGFQKRNGMVYYFNGSMPVYQHSELDYKSFRLYTSQLVINGNSTQKEIANAFGVSEISVKRWVKRLREEGAQGFFLAGKSKIVRY